jgi:DNA-binding transcriptional MerR regulator
MPRKARRDAAERPLRTTEVARAVGVHPNTVRLYEKWGFLPPVSRTPSGYRQFTQAHIDQMRLARTALQYPYPGGKEPVLALVYSAAAGDLGDALEQAYRYLAQIRAERAEAEAAAEFLDHWARGEAVEPLAKPLLIGQAAKRLRLTIDTLRSWERNGLLQVPRDPASGYRLYGAAEIGRARVVRLLRAAGYSSMAILRMFLHLERGRGGDLRHALDTPAPDEDVYTAADRWLSALQAQEDRALDVIAQLRAMIQRRPPA